MECLQLDSERQKAAEAQRAADEERRKTSGEADTLRGDIDNLNESLRQQRSASHCMHYVHCAACIRGMSWQSLQGRKRYGKLRKSRL